MAYDLDETLKEVIKIPGLGPERIRTFIYPTPEEAAREVARIVAEKIQKRAEQGRTLVLGLPTGTTPIPFYQELVRLHREEGLSFQNVITFNLDEYYPVAPDSVHSYNTFIERQLLSQIDIPRENIHFLKGDVPEDELYEYCASYEAAIAEAGGLDIQILGVGRTGHVGFNEPGSPDTTMTRAVTLDRLTRMDAAEEFLGIEHVPRKALTMGIGTIMKARRIYLMAWGKAKAQIIKDSLEGEVSSRIPPPYSSTTPTPASTSTARRPRS